jgi:hypothetical protein
VIVGRHALFDKAHFVGAGFFYKAQFMGNTSFDDAKFDGETQLLDWFDGEGDEATLRVGGALFKEACFAGRASFYRVAFGGESTFKGATFAGPSFFDSIRPGLNSTDE